MSELTIIKNKIDLSKIIKAVFNMQDWGKTYTIYNYGKFSINIKLSSWTFEDNVGIFNVKVTPNNNSFRNSSINYYANNMTINDLSKLIKKVTLKEIDNYIYQTLHEEAEKEYSNLKYYRFKLTETDIINSRYEKKYYKLLELEVEDENDEDLKEDLIYALKTKVVDELNADYNKKVMDYIENNKFKFEQLSKIKQEIKQELEEQND